MEASARLRCSPCPTGPSRVYLLLAAFLALLLAMLQVWHLGSLGELGGATWRRRRAVDWVAGMDRWDRHATAFKQAERPLLALRPLAGTQQDRVLVLYSYAHAEWRLKNLRFFLRHGLARHAAGRLADYVIIVNGEVEQARAALDDTGVPYTYIDVELNPIGEAWLPTADGGDREVLLVRRKNAGFDFCAYKTVLSRGIVPHPGRYTHVFTINASVRGPFIPPAAVGVSWLDLFLSRMTERVRLVGTTINCMPLMKDDKGAYVALHLQSMLLAWELEAITAAAWALQCMSTFNEVVSHCEVGATQAVLEAGYGVTALQATFAEFSITKQALHGAELARRCSAVSDEDGGDPQYDGAYAGGVVHPYEVLFIKTNRHLTPEAIERLTALHNNFDADAQLMR